MHNAQCAQPKPDGSAGGPKDNIDAFIEGKKPFEEVINDYAETYADLVNKNVKWSWNEDIKGGRYLDKTQKGLIRQQAVANGSIPDVKVAKVEGMKYGFADFKGAGVVRETRYLPKELWKAMDGVQFDWLDKQIGGKVDGDVWHHTEIPGKMEQVPYGIHNIVNHNGGRTRGMWADAPRK